MSFILDALRKSEAERQREDAPSLSQLPLATLPRATPTWTWVVIGILMLALAALGLALWRASPEGTGTIATSNVANEPAVPAANSLEAPTPLEREQGGPVTAAETSAGQDPEPPLSAEPRPIRELATLDPTLPEFRLEFLAYDAADSARSSAWINGSIYRIGERVADGPELAEIHADSVVLRYRGESFVLRTR